MNYLDFFKRHVYISTSDINKDRERLKKFHHEEGGILFAQKGGKALATGIESSKIEDLQATVDEEKKEDGNTITTTSTSASNQTDDYSWTKAKVEQYLGRKDGKLQTTNYTLSTSYTPPSAAKAATYKETMNYLMSKGFNKEAAAGITGVFMAESGLVAGRTNQEEDAAYGSTAGRGLGQWSNERRKQYDDYMRGKEITLQNDLDFFIQDLESRPLVKQALQNATNVEDAVKAMHLGYENGSAGAMATPEQLTKRYTEAWANLGYKPYSYGESHSKRYNFAQQAYNS